MLPLSELPFASALTLVTRAAHRAAAEAFPNPGPLSSPAVRKARTVRPGRPVPLVPYGCRSWHGSAALDPYWMNGFRTGVLSPGPCSCEGDPASFCCGFGVGDRLVRVLADGRPGYGRCHDRHAPGRDAGLSVGPRSSVNYGLVRKDAGDALRGACPVVASFGAKDRFLRAAPRRLDRALGAAGGEQALNIPRTPVVRQSGGCPVGGSGRLRTGRRRAGSRVLGSMLL